MRVFDVFPFYNELDLLELRLDELNGVVDVFGLVELPVTFTGLKKALYYDQHKERFSKYSERIRQFIPKAYPSGGHPMVDWFQRRQLARLFSDAEPDDLIIVSDVDEIPSKEIVQAFKDSPPEHPVALSMKLYYHRVNLQSPYRWNGTIVSKRSSLGEDPDTQELRDLRNCLPTVDGGWHFSWLGTVEQIQDKLKAVDIVTEARIYGGDVKQPENSAEFLEACRRGDSELLGREGYRNTSVPIVPGVNQPSGIMEWLERHPHYAN
jgi:beta-1,4-mannosyl-glycoprotein beta-1,4-N-acetylglucosaminyltransferase